MTADLVPLLVCWRRFRRALTVGVQPAIDVILAAHETNGSATFANPDDPLEPGESQVRQNSRRGAVRASPGAMPHYAAVVFRYSASLSRASPIPSSFGPRITPGTPSSRTVISVLLSRSSRVTDRTVSGGQSPGTP